MFKIAAVCAIMTILEFTGLWILHEEDTGWDSEPENEKFDALATG